MQGARRHPDDSNTQARMHKSLIEERPFIRRHAAIVASFAIKQDVRGDNGTADDSGTVEELLSRAGGVRARNLAAGLHVGATEGLLEGISRFCKGGDGRNGL